MESKLAQLIRETCEAWTDDGRLQESLRERLKAVAHAAMIQERNCVLVYMRDHPEMTVADFMGAIAEGAHP
jgi:predicted sulfurtransferase